MLPITYRVGGEQPVVRMRVKSDDAVRPIWTVTAAIRGREQPDDLVIVGNHRDAWIYGGVDPSSGSAALMELARTLGELKRTGWQPRRTIVFASWDAEEFTLTSSTEWGEQHEETLRSHAVAYLNVDSAASGPNFTVTAVPALNRVLGEAAGIDRADDAVGSRTCDRCVRVHHGKLRARAWTRKSRTSRASFFSAVMVVDSC